jgi:hypothetical protein
MVNTLDVNRIAVSEPLVATARAEGYSLLGSPRRAEFGRDGRLLRIGGIDFFSDHR